MNSKLTTIFKNLIPAPREIRIRPGREPLPSDLKMVFNHRATEVVPDLPEFAAAVCRTARQSGCRRSLTVDARLEPSRHRHGIPPVLLTQAYELTIGSRVTLIAGDGAGLRFGLQTLRQILEDAHDLGFLPHAHLRDWPRIASRGIHVDLAREMEYRPSWLRRIVENLAYFKMNTLHLYLENKFVYPSAPEVASPGSMTPAQARELCRYARRFGITIIPQIATMGHMEHLLNERYAELREDPASSFNLCPTHPRARPFLAGLIADVAAAFESPFIHVGYDESHSGVCARCRAHGRPPEILAEHLNWLNTEVKKRGARTMIYGDKFLSREEFPRLDAANGGTPAEAHAALERVDRDIVITDWHYTAPHAGTVRYLVRRGFDVQIATATNIYWHDSIPLHRGHHWVVESLDRAIEEGATGAFNTNWEYYRGQFLENYWYFEGLAAERMWTDAPHDYVAWGRRFSARFWGVREDYYSELAGLAESVSTSRRAVFVDSHVLAVDIPDRRQAERDYPETGKAVIDLVQRLRRAAQRNQDTLRMLDMPGQVIRYIGIRALQCALLNQAFHHGDKQAALRRLNTIRQAGRAVAARLADGYRTYGGAVQDRERIARHIQTLDRCLALVRRSGARKLRDLTVDELILRDEEIQDDPRHFINRYRAAPCLPPPDDIRRVNPPSAKPTWSRIPVRSGHVADTRSVHGGRDGLVYILGQVRLPRAGKGRLRYGADGPVKVWVNGGEVGCAPKAANPAVADAYCGPATWRKGLNEILFALHTNRGRAWGVIARWQIAD